MSLAGIYFSNECLYAGATQLRFDLAYDSKWEASADLGVPLTSPCVLGGPRHLKLPWHYHMFDWRADDLEGDQEDAEWYSEFGCAGGEAWRCVGIHKAELGLSGAAAPWVIKNGFLLDRTASMSFSMPKCFAERTAVV